MELRGIFPVLPTPFDAEGKVDLAAVTRVVEFVLACGAHGVVFPGVASEFDYQTREERESTFRLVAECVGGQVPLIVGASAETADAALAFAEAGAAVGAAAAMVMAPASLGGDPAAASHFFQIIATHSSVPLMLQNAPPPVGAGLSIDTTLSVVQSVPQVRYVKEEIPPTGYRLSRLLAAAPANLIGVFGGAGARYAIDELNRGALGLMPAAELSDLHVALYAAHRAGAHGRARQTYRRTLPLLLIQEIFRMRLTKEVLRRRGVLQHADVRAPLPDFDAQDQREIDLCLRDLEDLLTTGNARQAVAMR